MNYQDYPPLTISQAALKEFKKFYKQEDFDLWFPNLAEIELDREQYGSSNIDEYCRKAYYGGWCYVDERRTGIPNGYTVVYDVNSLYPSVLHSKSGNYYPVGGRVTGILGDRMTVDKGFEHGIGKDMQMIVFAPVSGVDVPIGVAEASPADKTSNIKVWRWNTDDEYAEEIIKEMRKDRSWIKKNECFAVSLRMAVPPEWDQDPKDLDRVK
jgi:hypothetical protein